MVTRRLNDFPFYAGAPVLIEGRGWLLILAGVALGFAALVALPFSGWPASLLPPVLFAAIPLAALAAVVGRRWTALFRRVGFREVGIACLTAIATILASMAAALALRPIVTGTANPAVEAMTSMSVGDFALRLLPTAPQLLGEELLTILPFLAILWFGTQRLGLGRKAAMLAAVIGSTAIFAAAHLPTYDWNWVQCFGVIGAARVVLTLSYIWTRNLFVPVAAHIANDWTEFIFVYGFGHTPIGSQMDLTSG